MSRLISDMQPGEQIDDQVFVVADKDLRTTTSGGLYIHALLRDRSGTVPARMWQATEEMYDQLKVSPFVRIRGRTESYKGHLQVIIDGVNPADRDTVNVADLLPTTSGDIPAMWERVKTILRGVGDADLLYLVKGFVEDPDLVERFCRAPAAIKMHHAYIGGLLEHTLNLMELALVVAPRYPEVSRDLVVVGLFLHDLGKTAELGFDATFQYTSEGQLVGHITQGILMLEDKLRAFEQSQGRPFPPDKKWALQHIVLAHHGKLEFGSPRQPATPEAFLVHHLDVLDARMQQVLDRIADDPDATADWTSYVPALETRLFKRDVVPDGN